jgi:hypothetical protein
MEDRSCSVPAGHCQKVRTEKLEEGETKTQTRNQSWARRPGRDIQAH